jgi:hypothetical protein
MEQLSMKTGIEVSEVKQLLQLIHELRLGSLSVSDEFLFELYKRMQQFYKTK